MSPVLRPRVLSSNAKLWRIAAYVGLIGSSSLLALKWFSDRRVRRSEYYVKATSHLMNYQPTVDLFGPPIYFGNVDMSDKRNITTTAEIRVVIPVVGSKCRGLLHSRAVREVILDEDVLESQSSVRPWLIDQMEVTIDNRPGEIARIPLKEPIVVGANKQNEIVNKL